MTHSRSRVSLNCLRALCALAVMLSSIARADVQQLQASFTNPPDEAKMMVRWWWFGPAVTHAQLEREMKLMKEGGIGGFEIEPIYPLALDNERPGLKNLPIGSPEFHEALKFTAAKSKELGLRMDLTLGSGWPYGGKQFTAKEGATAVTSQNVPVPAGTKSVPVPAGPQGQQRSPVAAFINIGENWKELPIKENVVEIPTDVKGESSVLFVLAREGIMQVKRPAAEGDGHVIDHYSPEVIEKFIREIGEPAIAACAPNFPYAIFCDSLEIGGENWTPNMLEEFKKRRGYDLRPLLPSLFVDAGPKTMSIRHDWMQTCTEMFNENFSARFKALAAKYGSRFRIQGYGSPPHAMYSYAYADLNEAEGFEWKTFDESRWASSASHLLGRPVTSSETWTWLKQGVFYATPLDVKADAHNHLLQGINQFIAHGWPYTAEGAPYPGWSMYAAAVFNNANPWWIVMPDLAKYLQRNSHMMRQGTPANDVLVLIPNSDAWAASQTSINGFAGSRVGGGGRGGGGGGAARGRGQAGPASAPAAEGAAAQGRGRRGGAGGGGANTGNITGSLLAAGYNLDYFDDQLLEMRGKIDGKTLAFGDVKYRAVVLPPTDYIMPATMKKLDEFAKAGGIVIAVGSAPKSAAGYQASDADHKIVADVAQRLQVVSNASELAATLTAKGLAPDVTFESANTDIGFVHRHTPDAEIYFIANTTNQPYSGKATFRVADGMNSEIWDANSGMIRATGTGKSVDIKLDAYGSTIVIFSNRRMMIPTATPAVASIPAPIDLSTGWTVKFGNEGPTVNMEQLKSWAEDEKTKAFSGVATYEKKFTVAPALLGNGVMVKLDLGTATAPEAGGGRGGSGYRTVIEPPVREAAIVYVNDKKIGSIWAPPYSINVTGSLKAGENTIRIEVANLAINYMAANGYPNYNLAGVRQFYGDRFQPQGLNNLQAMPSGLLGPIKLIAHGGGQ